jgi:hypothetical protein
MFSLPYSQASSITAFLKREANSHIHTKQRVALYIRTHTTEVTVNSPGSFDAYMWDPEVEAIILGSLAARQQRIPRYIALLRFK